MRMLLAAIVALIASSCIPAPIHEDCIGSSGCGYASVRVSEQNMAVTGADERSFSDGHGSCQTSQSTEGLNNEIRHVKVFVLQLWVPASSPHYKLVLRVSGYPGPGTFSSDLNQQLKYDPAKGGIVLGDVYLVPAPDRLAQTKTVTLTVDHGETSGALRIDLPDRTLSGTWTCLPEATP
ncbi:MAG: hypothetical protein E6I07_02755 [Chloroflexi bacterium]|nr:MAG: hypothetical protein E6I07_02755 [Chloroflexota bacterium]